MILEKTDKRYWDQIEVGDMISLSDPQSILDAQEAGLESFNLEVKRIRKITQEDDLVTWNLYDIQQQETNLVLLVKIVDAEIDTYIFFEEEELSQMDRDDLINTDLEFLFEEFNQEDIESSSELCFTSSIFKEECEFERKPQGELYGKSCVSPVQSGCDEVEFVTLVEYQADLNELDNNQFLILEEGGEDSPSGGLVTCYSGSPISMFDVELFKT